MRCVKLVYKYGLFTFLDKLHLTEMLFLTFILIREKEQETQEEEHLMEEKKKKKQEEKKKKEGAQKKVCSCFCFKWYIPFYVEHTDTDSAAFCE